ncbi:hypothetical protein C8J57DRAFT_1147968, partial [Mycena rebaudengoi]
MQLKTLYLPLLAFIFTVSFVDLPPVAALYFPIRLADGITTSIFAFVQQHVASDSGRSKIHMDEVDLNPERFWQRARELGDTARRYGEKLMEDAAARSKDVREKIDELKERMDTILRGATALHDELGTSVKRTRRSIDGSDVDSADSADDLRADLARAFEKVYEELEAIFPAPNEAPGHEERQKVVAVALEKARAALVTVCVKHGMDEERVGVHWRTVRPAIENMVVLLGDLVEQHPDLLSALLFASAVMLIPEYFLLRPLLSVFGFGPIGPVKGTAASWAQRVFYGAAVNKGSWFAYLDKAAM